MSREDRERWSARHSQAGVPSVEAPEPFLVEHADLLVPGRALDLACGRGRNTRFLAARGLSVIGVDVSRPALRLVREPGSSIHCVEMDLDQPAFRPASLDNVICISFLDRRLFGLIRRWLRPGGMLLTDTFSIDQRSIGHPRDPRFLLGHGELRALLGDYHVVRYREGLVTDGPHRSYRAGAVARVVGEAG